MKESVKSAIGLTVFASSLSGVLLRKTAVVVAFHRVRNTPTLEGLTVSIPVFERYCQFFKDYFQVVSLRELVSRLEGGQKLNRELAITFDDGYEDNFENAAPVLERLSLPATFFVVSQWIGTDIVPWWDRQEGVRYPWMTWEQVRALQHRGFDIGAHTRTHVDLGASAWPKRGRRFLALGSNWSSGWNAPSICLRTRMAGGRISPIRTDA